MKRSRRQAPARWRLRCLALAVGIGLPAAIGFQSSPASAGLGLSTGCFGITVGTGSYDAVMRPIGTIIASLPCVGNGACPLSKLYVSGP